MGDGEKRETNFTILDNDSSRINLDACGLTTIPDAQP